MKHPSAFLPARVYDLSPRDMDEVINFISEIVDRNTKEIDLLEEKMKIEGPDIVDNMMDDLRPHNFFKNSFLWESCVWRLQGIFEGILDERFLKNDRKYGGLSHRLNSLKEQGFKIISEDELKDWAYLRNELSHNPPKQINGHGAKLTKGDIIAFREFLVDILRDLERQKQADLVKPD